MRGSAGAGGLVVAHRGASTQRPEHTEAAYRLAVAEGADAFDVDLVTTADGVLVARHENELSDTTDVADHPGLAHLRTTREVDGVRVDGWFAEDLTLEQVRRLRTRERLPRMRPTSAAHDGEQGVMTFAEVLALRAELSSASGREIGVWPELKHPGHLEAMGLPLEPLLLAALRAAGLLDGAGADAPVVVQCFEVTPLQRLRSAAPGLRLVQLTQPTGSPPDLRRTGDHRDYADLCTAAGLREVAAWADVLSPHLVQVEPRDVRGTSRGVRGRSDLVVRAHAAGLDVVPYTVRPENTFLPAELRSGPDLGARGDVAGLLARLWAVGVDGVFSDDVPAAVASRPSSPVAGGPATDRGPGGGVPGAG